MAPLGETPYGYVFLFKGYHRTHMTAARRGTQCTPKHTNPCSVSKEETYRLFPPSMNNDMSPSPVSPISIQLEHI